MKRRQLLSWAGSLGTLLASPQLIAQDDRSTITIYVGAASSMDFAARAIAEHLREALGRPVIVVSRLGAGQRLALGEVRRAAPDGRSLVFVTNGPFSIYPHIYTKLDYDPVADFTPVAGVSYFDVALSTLPSATGANDVKGIIDWARAQQGKAVFGSAPGNGSLSHFLGISISLATGIPMTHVPYKDSGVGLLDVAAGRLPLMITGLSGQVALHKAGKIKILAVSGDKRSPLVPDVPTLAEAGVAVTSSTGTGLFGPARLPPDIVRRYHDALQPWLANPAVRDKFAEQAMTLWPQTPQQLANYVADERRRFEVIVKAAGYTPEAS